VVWAPTPAQSSASNAEAVPAWEWAINHPTENSRTWGIGIRTLGCDFPVYQGYSGIGGYTSGRKDCALLGRGCIDRERLAEGQSQFPVEGPCFPSGEIETIELRVE
jgi:hypothetical protein